MGDQHTVLVVEDEWTAREVAVMWLQTAGFRVMTAENGEHAASLLRDGASADLVLTDINLGGHLNGWDIGTIAREVCPDMPVVYVSGLCDNPLRRVGGSLFFAKPYDCNVVLEACCQMCREADDRTH